jgi:predicted RNase H-like HicB family nuclease
LPAPLTFSFRHRDPFYALVVAEDSRLVECFSGDQLRRSGLPWRHFALVARTTAGILLQRIKERTMGMTPRKYLVILEHAESSSFSAHVPDLPGCVATGQTRQECLQNIREAVSMHIDGMREDGLAIPEPSSEAGYAEAVA